VDFLEDFMATRVSLLTAAILAATALPVPAAQFEQSGSWVFNSTAVAADGDRMLSSCTASTVSAEGTELSLIAEPLVETGFDARMVLTNKAWALGDGPLRVRFDIGADHWVLPGQGAGQAVEISWTGDAGFVTFVEDLASSSFAGLTGRDGAAIAQFSLKGSRGAIEAMKTCVEAQIGQPLGEAFATAPGAANPF